MPVDVNRNTEGVVLPVDVSDEIWSKAIEASAIMQLAQQKVIPTGAGGQEFQIISGDPTPNWVDETELKAVDLPQFSNKKWRAYKMAVVVPMSNEFLRDNDALYSEIVSRVPQKLGEKFDRTVFGIDEKPGELFDTLADCSSFDIKEDTWGGLVNADAAISENDGITNGIALAPAAKPILLTAMDNVGRPLFISSMNDENAAQRLMGYPITTTKGVYDSTANPVQFGFMGDWTSAYYGVAADITMRVSEDATIKTEGGDIYLFQQNMTALLFEMEVGFITKYKDHFAKLVG